MWTCLRGLRRWEARPLPLQLLAWRCLLLLPVLLLLLLLEQRLAGPVQAPVKQAQGQGLCKVRRRKRQAGSTWPCLGWRKRFRGCLATANLQLA